MKLKPMKVTRISDEGNRTTYGVKDSYARIWTVVVSRDIEGEQKWWRWSIGGVTNTEEYGKPSHAKGGALEYIRRQPPPSFGDKS